MALDIAKLENVKCKEGGKIIARCPACSVDGNDSKGEHLVVYPDGAYACVVNPQDEKHSKKIFKLVGIKRVANPTKPFEVNRYVPPPSTTVVVLDRFSIDRLKSAQPPLFAPCAMSEQMVLKSMENGMVNITDVSDGLFSLTRKKLNNENGNIIKGMDEYTSETSGPPSERAGVQPAHTIGRKSFFNNIPLQHAVREKN